MSNIWFIVITFYRFVLGLALCKQKGGAAKRKAEALGYLSEGLELLLNQIVKRRNQPKYNKERTELLSSSLLRPDSVLCMQGILTLADQLVGMQPPPQSIMSTFDVYHCGVYLATRVLSKLVARGDTYHQLEWLALEGKSSLLQMLMEENTEKSEEQNNVIKKYCDYLSALIKCSTVPPGPQLLDLQQKVCWLNLFQIFLFFLKVIHHHHNHLIIIIIIIITIIIIVIIISITSLYLKSKF